MEISHYLISRKSTEHTNSFYLFLFWRSGKNYSGSLLNTLFV